MLYNMPASDTETREIISDEPFEHAFAMVLMRSEKRVKRK